ncbi:MAG: multicopper oxidase domain-containing protein [Methylococcales bacterium]|nr:multicopper oxidase domain-containing protein [Methylococcales bacterium]
MRASKIHAQKISPSELELINPEEQPKFCNLVPSALESDIRFTPLEDVDDLKSPQFYIITVAQYKHDVGLVDSEGKSLLTTMWGYGNNKQNVSWPGKTIEVFKDTPVWILWKNDLTEHDAPLPHLLPVDTNGHWCYSLPNYQQYCIENNGVPLVPHLHGGHTKSKFDGNPEYFFSPHWQIKGPRWTRFVYKYHNDQQAGCLWYHDHALGITRLNVYAGLAGFYIVRDKHDTGRHGNPIGLPAEKYELAYAIQDRMFHSNGELFYPAFPGEPAYDDFITDIEDPAVELPADKFPDGGPTALAEFFGDHIVVNGKIWPKTEVEPRHYRLRLLNGCDSRFLAIRFRLASTSGSTDLNDAGEPLPFWIIGSDQGLAEAAIEVDTLLFNPADRHDIIFDFSQVPAGMRIIMDNIAGDAPFSGELTGDQNSSEYDPKDLFENRQTDRIMAFDVNQPLSNIRDCFFPESIHHFQSNTLEVDKVRKVALFEGRDEFGRLQPMQGVAEPTQDVEGNIVNGALPWHMPITENPDLNSTEIWEIYNNTEDAHPVHLHLVSFEILNSEEFTSDLIKQPVKQHDGSEGIGFIMENIELVNDTLLTASGVNRAPKDMVTCLPGRVTRIKITFDRPGRYVWHCHILSHEDHDMMRPMHVGSNF